MVIFNFTHNIYASYISYINDSYIYYSSGDVMGISTH